MINYPTKFAVGEKVVITCGLYRGRTGVVVSYIPQINMGLARDLESRNISEFNGMYSVRLGFLKFVTVLESAISLLVENKDERIKA